MHIGFHTDAFNSAHYSFEAALEWASKNGVRYIECGLIDGDSWLQGLGYLPHCALTDDPVLLKKKMDGYGVQFSQVDAAFPLSGPEGVTRGVQYVHNCIRWAKLAGCDFVDTTDGMDPPAGMDDERAMELMTFAYGQIMEVADAYEITVNIEPHGHFTTNPDYMERMLNFTGSPRLKMNMDTGNTFIAGRDPVDFLKKFVGAVSHVHLKDVSESLAAAARGEDTGIALSECSVGDGVNADAIKTCLAILRDNDYDGAVSVECEGDGGPLLERSVEWVRATFSDLGIAES